ncbi:hypothetical protein DRO64_03950, partial [Candidatus Bathyarchaeota archaeon]
KKKKIKAQLFLEKLYIMRHIAHLSKMAKKYKDVKLREDLVDIIDKYIVGRHGFRSRSEYVTQIILKDLIKRGLIKKEEVK